MFVARRVGLAIACVAVVPTLTQAQAGLLAGFAFENGKAEYQQGFSFEGSYTVGGTKTFGVRFDVGVQAFIGQTHAVGYLCPAQGCQPRPLQGTSLTVLFSGASLVLNKDLGANRVYWMAGIGGYELNDMPTGHYTRFGWNGGAGIHLGKHVVAELRYHGIIDPRGSRGLVPIIVGFRF